MLSFPNNYTRGGIESLKYSNTNVGARGNTVRINTEKIKSANISLNSSMSQKFLDTDVIAISNNENRIRMGQTTIGDVATEYKNLNMYHGKDGFMGTTAERGKETGKEYTNKLRVLPTEQYDTNLYWDNENPFQIPAGIIKTVNRYNRVYKTPVNNLLNIGYDNGEDTRLQNDSSSYAIEFQAAKTVVVSSIFNPTHMIQVNGLSDNIPIMNMDPEGTWNSGIDVALGDSYTLGVSADARTKAANEAWDKTHTKNKSGGSLIDEYLKANQDKDNKTKGGMWVDWDNDETKDKGTVWAHIDYAPFDVTQHTSNTSNCTIRELVKLSHGRNTIIGQGRYKYSDFLFCRDFGKVSNNHMITLRRFAHPVEDNIFRFSGKKHRNREDYGNNDYQENAAHGTMITWFGTDDNKLEDIMKYSVKSTWKELEAKIENVESQEDNESNGIIGMLANSFSPGYNSLVARGMAGSNSLWGHFGSRMIGGVMGRMGLPNAASGGVNSNSMKQWDLMRAGRDENRIYTPKNTIQKTHK